MGVSICQPLAVPRPLHVGLWRHPTSWSSMVFVEPCRPLATPCHHAAFHLSAMSASGVSLPTSDLGVLCLAASIVGWPTWWHGRRRDASCVWRFVCFPVWRAIMQASTPSNEAQESVATCGHAGRKTSLMYECLWVKICVCVSMTLVCAHVCICMMDL